MFDVEMSATPIQAATSRSPSPADCPTDFAYWTARERPAMRRARRVAKALLRFDPLPADEVAEALSRAMHGGDPVAERFVDEVFFGEQGYRLGRVLLDRAIEHGIASVPDAPASMQTLFREFEEVPDWVDRTLVEEGAAIWRRWGTTLFSVAGAGTLEMYTESAVAVPLALAGGYAGDTALRRFLETAQFWIDVSQPGALFSPGSAGRATALRVRVMHVSVRRRVSDHEEWDAERWGLPISQAYMLLTLMGGSVGPAVAMWPMGFLTSPREIRSLLHFQRYMGHLLGVDVSRYPTTVRSGLQLVIATAVGRTHTAGSDGAELIESFPKAFAPRQHRRGLAGWRDRYQHRLMCGYCAVLMAPGTRRAHDMPAFFPWALLVFARVPMTLASELARLLLPGAAVWLERRACRKREAWLETQMNGRKAAFDASSGLGR
jgi:hypothetical protein